MKQEPVVILYRPQLGENIGTSARAMCNAGLKEMRLVCPRERWPNEKAIAAASGALEHINVQVFQTLEEATSDLHVIFATTARRRMQPITPEQAADAMDAYARKDNSVGVLFGAERSGLDNDCLSRGNYVIEIPANPNFKSFNLAQAVLIIAYEWQKKQISQSYFEECEKPEDQPAPRAQLDYFLSRLDTVLRQVNFYKSAPMQPVIFRNLRRYFQRSTPSGQELRTLHGIVTLIEKNALITAPVADTYQGTDKPLMLKAEN